MEKLTEKRKSAPKSTAKNAMIRARTTTRLKDDAEHIFEKLGLSSTEAINMFYSLVCLHKGLPFEVKIPNELTRATFAKTDRGEEVVKSGSANEMFKKLGL
ncbi:MAG: type II toxin-antitoxin system RelB/DinJ family antitoxin [Deltaproteobacteria bacterium]|nr:type II toxin-antitoxin system RelB/DinJ family antitoxin [Deltaproteobacteria bacterium]